MADTRPRNEKGDQPKADRRQLVQLAYRFLWNRPDAEDAVQNALTLAHQNRSELRDETKRWSWLCRIVVRQCFLLRRAENRRASRDRAIPPHEGVYPADPVAASERAEVVRWAIDRLPPRQRTAITLRHLEEMSYERIAAIMGISPSTARVHVRDARETMRMAISEREGPHVDAGRERR